MQPFVGGFVIVGLLVSVLSGMKVGREVYRTHNSFYGVSDHSCVLAQFRPEKQVTFKPMIEVLSELQFSRLRCLRRFLLIAAALLPLPGYPLAVAGHCG